MIEIMKAITLWQPWADLVARGYKEVETRSWATNYRGPIAIHAAKSFPKWVKPLFKMIAKILGEERYEGSYWYYLAEKVGAYGSIVATANLIDCVQINAEDPGKGKAWGEKKKSYYTFEGNEYHFGDYTPGRYAWILEDIQALPEPIPARGGQRIWNWERVIPE